MFFVLALPRSRTKWLSRFLSYDGQICGHDTGVRANSLDEFLEPFKSGKLAGSVETAGMLGWKILKKEFPKAKFLAIFRPEQEVLQSLLQLGVNGWNDLQVRLPMLQSYANSGNVQSFSFQDLYRPEVCRWIFEQCLEKPWDDDWYEDLRAKNIQIDFRERMVELGQRAPQLAKFREEVLAKASAISGGLGCMN